MSSSVSEDHYHLRWNNHQPNFVSAFSTLLTNEALVDVTLAAEGKYIQTHKVVLSACSSYFQVLFSSNPCRHPIVILKDIAYNDLKVVVEFMYCGEVNITHDQLAGVLKTAETLCVKGLADMPEFIICDKTSSNSGKSDKQLSVVENKRKRLRRSSTSSSVEKPIDSSTSALVATTASSICVEEVKILGSVHSDSLDSSAASYESSFRKHYSSDQCSFWDSTSSCTLELVEQKEPPGHQLKLQHQKSDDSTGSSRGSKRHKFLVRQDCVGNKEECSSSGCVAITETDSCLPSSEEHAPEEEEGCKERAMVCMQRQYSDPTPHQLLHTKKTNLPVPVLQQHQSPQLVKQNSDSVLTREHKRNNNSKYSRKIAKIDQRQLYNYELLPIEITAELRPTNHCPVLRPGPALGCTYCWNTVDERGKILRRKTKYHCPECQANLCIVPCFQDYHDKRSSNVANSSSLINLTKNSATDRSDETGDDVCKTTTQPVHSLSADYPTSSLHPVTIVKTSTI